MRTLLAVTGLAAAFLSVPALAQGSSPDTTIYLHYAHYDPATTKLDIPVLLRGDERTNLWIVQFQSAATEQNRAAVRAEGGQVHGYLPENAYVVRMTPAVAAGVMKQRAVRAVTYYHPIFRLEPFLIAEMTRGMERGIEAPRRRYNIVVVDKHRDKPGLIAKIRRFGGVIENEQPDSILLEASLTGAQLLQAVRLDEVLWIDLWTPAEMDMNNARIQGGGNYVEAQGKYTGKGINGHIYEGIEAGHQDFTNRGINVLSCGSAQSHGHATAGIVFGNGTSHRDARGMAPDAQPFYTTNSCVSTSRWRVVEALVKTHKVSFTTASWGGGRTTAYTSVSADSDDIIFDHDMVWTNSQSNAGNQMSRPQAWAKNIFSIGGVAHRNNSNPLDDSWRSGNGSTGPAADGRIKPDLAAYYDGIMTSDLTGSAGYNRSGNYYASFGGTSGATPIVAGHNAIAIQMFADGLFSPKRKQNGTPFENKPHFTTLKALQIANASQYSFTSNSTDNRREHVGWGFPNLKTMYDNRKVHFVVDETDLITQGRGWAYTIRVASGQAELKICMTHADPAGNPSASFTRINDLTLRVTDPNGNAYWGNHGLKQGNYSLIGGVRDERDTVECVFVKNPAVGNWKVEVLGYRVAMDSHVETTATDADFGLVVNGGTFVSKSSVQLAVGSFTTFGKSCPGNGLVKRVCQSANENAQFRTSTSYAGVTYAVEIVASQNLDIEGYEMQNQSASSSSVTLATRLYDATNSGQPNRILATGTMVVGTRVAWYKTTFSQKVQVKQGQKYFLAFVNSSPTGTRLGTMNTGTRIPYWRNNGGGGSWVRFTTLAWSYRTICSARSGSVLPVMASNDTPTLGQRFTLVLRGAIPNSPATLWVGASNSIWKSLRLPYNLSAIGGGTCLLSVSPDVWLSYRTNSVGAVNAGLVAPSNPSLLGARVHVQFAITDAKANSLGLVTTNAGTLVLGN